MIYFCFDKFVVLVKFFFENILNCGRLMNEIKVVDIVVCFYLDGWFVFMCV